MTDEIDLAKPVRKKKKPDVKRGQYIGPDGFSRGDKVEHELNEAFAIVFRGAAAARVLNYLRSITTNQVMAPGTDPNVINYHEGSRWLMGIIDTRIKHGEDKKP